MLWQNDQSYHRRCRRASDGEVLQRPGLLRGPVWRRHAGLHQKTRHQRPCDHNPTHPKEEACPKGEVTEVVRGHSSLVSLQWLKRKRRKIDAHFGAG